MVSCSVLHSEVCLSIFSNGLLLVLGLYTHIARCHRFDSGSVFGPDRAVAASSSSSFPPSLHLGPQDPLLEMWLVIRLAAIWIRLVIRIRLIIWIQLVIWLHVDALPSASTM